MHDAAAFEAGTPEENRLTARGIEVGHIFYFGTKYSAPMKAKVAGSRRQGHRGPHGQLRRRRVASAGRHHRGQPRRQRHHLARLGRALRRGRHQPARLNDEAVSAACEEAVAKLEASGKDVLYDDTDERPGGKFATADLIGVPWQLTIGPKGLADGVVELKRRATGEKQTLPLAQALEIIG
jgi:prolyl-tRNA synthetase